MKYWIGINVISNNQGLLKAVGNAIPDKTDGRLWQTSEYESITDVNFDGNNFIFTSLFYESENDRTNFHSALKGINGMLHSALSGSYIKMTKCWHDEKVNGLCIKLDELTFEEVV